MAKAAPTIHLQEFADDHGVTIRSVTNWLAEGMPHRTYRGERRVVRKDANAWVVERAEKKARDRVTRAGILDKDAEQALKIRVERQMKEIDLAVKRGEFLPAGDFASLTDRLIGGFAAVTMSRLQPFEREMGIEPAAARAITQRMQEELMKGAQTLAQELEEEADAIARAAIEAEEMEAAAEQALLNAAPDVDEDAE